MANHNYYFTPEVESALNELRIDTIRENKEMSEQQVVIECIFEKFSRKHAEHSRNYYHRHKNDPEFIRRQRESTKRWKEKHKEAK